jgi:parvulin-like peptidyl-prolyl isomerase
VDGLPAEVQDALATLNIDEPSRPVRTPLGYAILCIRSTRQTYDSALQEILQSLYDARAIDNLEEWKSDLREKHSIRILDLDFYEGRAEQDAGSAEKS